MTDSTKHVSDNTRPQPPTPKELIELANSYAQAADKLQQLWKKGHPVTHAPFRFVALHAIELYLSAYLQLKDHDQKKIRGLHHDLMERTTRALESGLILRKRTIEHLGQLTTASEYTSTRYKPATLKRPTPPTQLQATLRDVADKVRAAVH